MLDKSFGRSTIQASPGVIVIEGRANLKLGRAMNAVGNDEPRQQGTVLRRGLRYETWLIPLPDDRHRYIFDFRLSAEQGCRQVMLFWASLCRRR